ncbi:hypothetical protein GXY_04829 [Novacetimonas hansenii ATCC 23769]|uniref:Uncharacterized protein n=1 Tax=Novacetimonas hansenii ATCC 23769 TaxID=714995 RepID=D5QCW0_NOVHA|nr:hypothetical protein GXY_04829 [Novacetimonas hansenii ATCC 23769]
MVEPPSWASVATHARHSHMSMPTWEKGRFSAPCFKKHHQIQKNTQTPVDHRDNPD